jgi:hypothetical protein
MKELPGFQKGASAIGTVILLAVMAYGVFLGIQYAPQFLESKAVDSVLRTMKSSQDTDQVTTESAARRKINNLLHMNEMTEMSKNLTVNSFNGKITIKFKYERELNLGYKTQKINHEKSLVLHFQD